MTRFLPRSLLGQVMLALAVALLVAQGISTALLYRAAEQRREAALMHAAAFQLATGAQRARGDETPAMHRMEGMHSTAPRYARRFTALRLPRAIRYTESDRSPALPGEGHEAKREAALSELLQMHGIVAEEVAVVVRPFDRDPVVVQALDRNPRLRRRLAGLSDRLPERLVVAGIRQQGQTTWQVARLPLPRRDRSVLPTLVFQTAILFAVLVGLLYFVLRRITRPLAVLAERTHRFAGSGTAEAPLAATGPEDVRRLIGAHNAMQARIASMLDEKDVMLGAIGHDLKTPLAALRVRIESVDDPVQRTKMAATIEEIARTLDEILELARIGRSQTLPERTDIAALAASVVEEFEDMGEAVRLAESGRVVAPAHLTWLKRGLRNLVANALRYGGSAQVSVRRMGDEIVLAVEDEGPGIPEDRIAEMLEPFVRGEGSRNRETGGAGLGLTIARAVAEQHGGRLVLANRAEGGLRAELRLPGGTSAPA